MNFTPICKLEDIPVLGSRIVKRTGQIDIAIFRNDQDKVFALLDSCPHKGGPLSQGIVHGTSVTCPLHNWVISLETGKALGADQGCTRTIPVKRDGDTILIALDAQAERAA